MLDEAGGVIVGRAQCSWVVQQADYRTRACLSGEPGESALTGLSSTIESDNTGICQCFGQELLSSAGN
jgi:hypothetical protein